MQIQKFGAVSFSLALGACSTAVGLQYALPPVSNDYATVSQIASDHSEYVELSRSYIKVAPLVNANLSRAATNGSKDQSPQPPDPEKKQSSKPAPVQSKKSAVPASANHADEKPPVNNPGSETKDNDMNGNSKSGGASDAVNTSLIDGSVWTATVVPVPDDQYAFLVRSESGYWITNELNLGRYENTNIVSTVGTKQTNQVPKRLGQFAGVAAAMISLAGAAGFGVDSAGNRPAVKLLPFSIAVPENGKQIGDLNDGWTYAFEYDNPNVPAGTTSFSAFMQGTEGQKVSFWPVPACRSATLTLFPPENTSIGHNFLFNVIVSHPNVLRLQPVHANGTLNIGAICSASEMGATDADPTQYIVDDFSALQQGIKKITEVKPSKEGSQAAKAPGK